MTIGSHIVATEPMSEELATSVSPRGRTFLSVERAAAILRRALARPGEVRSADRGAPS